MAALSTIIMAAGLAVSTAGTVSAISESNRSNKLQKQSLELQRNQAEIEAGRSRRQAYRDMLKAQSVSETNAAVSGGSVSSSLEGGIAQAANSGLQSTRDINQNLDNANQMFDLKRSSIGIGSTSQALFGIGKNMSSLGSFFSGPNFNKPAVKT